MRSTVEGGGKNVLLATGGGGNSVATKVESLVGLSLSLRGHRVFALLCDGPQAGWFESTIDFDINEERFSRLGPSKFHCLLGFYAARYMYSRLDIEVIRTSDYLEYSDLMLSKQLSEEITANEIRDYELDGVAIGEHAYAGALRFYGRGVLKDKHSDAVLRLYFRAALQNHYAVKKIVKEKSIDKVLLHHGLYVPQGIIAESSRACGADIVVWHVAYRSKTFLFSHDETYHHTLMTEPVLDWEQIPWDKSKREKTLNYLNSRWYGKEDWVTFNKNSEDRVHAILEKVGCEREKPIVVLFTNVVWDAQLHYPTNIFPSMMDWLIHTVRVFAKNEELQLIIRVHPAEITGTVPSRQLVKTELEAEFPELPKNVFLVDSDSKISSYVLAELANGVLIYGTKMGVELAAKGKQVIVAGEAWVRGKGVTKDPESIEEYDDMLNDLPAKGDMPEDVRDRALKYAYHFFFRRMIPLSCIKSVGGTRIFDLNVKSPKDLLKGRDDGLDVICNGIIAREKFIYKEENQSQ